MAKKLITDLKLNVTLDIGQLVGVTRYSKKNQPVILRLAAQRYLRYLAQRAISLSGGRGEWPKLKPETIKRKERRGVATNAAWILREYNEILFQMGLRTIRQFIYVGYVRPLSHPRGLSLNRLVQIHTRGEGKNPVRRIIVLPPENVKKRMVDDVKKEYNRIIRQQRRK